MAYYKHLGRMTYCKHLGRMACKEEDKEILPFIIPLDINRESVNTYLINLKLISFRFPCYPIE